VSRPEPTETPRPLPRGILRELLGRGRFLLCLDYDGTLSQITADPARAFPLARARDAVRALARHPERLAVAIVSGREVDVVRRLLGLNSGLMFAGTHGLELVASDGRWRHPAGVEESTAELDAVRSFLCCAVPRERGFIVEDKRVALALHYRNADPAEACELLLRFERFVAENAPRLEIMRGNMVYEALARGLGGKGAAVKFLLQELGEPRPQTAYFGDDTTDEDAFFALGPENAVTVLVGPERRSFAKYRVAGPREVADLLADLAAQLEAGRP
jgi:trehalose-phosphatase